MQVVAAVEGVQQMVGMLRVTHEGIEINHRIKVARGANPLINNLAVGFAQRAGVVIARTNVRSDCSSVDAQAVRVGAFDDLLVGGDDLRDKVVMVGGRHFAVDRQPAQIVDALKENEPAHASLRQHIGIEARQNVRPQAVGQQVIAADALVGDANGSRFRRALQTAGQFIRPAVVSVGGGCVAVGDGVTENHDRSSGWRGLHVDPRNLIPVVDLLCVGEAGGADQVSV